LSQTLLYLAYYQMKCSSYARLRCVFDIVSQANQTLSHSQFPILGPKCFTTTCNSLLIHCLEILSHYTFTQISSVASSSCQNHIKHNVPVTQGCQCLARCFSQCFIKPYNLPWPCQFIKLPIFPHERSPPAHAYKCLHPWPFSGETNSKSYI